MIVGLLFITIIWYLHGFLSYKQVIHNSCNMGTRGLPDMYTLSPQACGPRALGIYISGKPLVPMLQLYIVTSYITRRCHLIKTLIDTFRRQEVDKIQVKIEI